MIYIEERRSDRMSGLTSLFLKFDFGPDFKTIIEKIKDTEIYYFNPKSKEWEVPLTSLSKIVSMLSKIDDITFKTYEEWEENKEELKPILSYKTKPMAHQLDAIKFGINNKRWLLLDAPGLGKSLSLIYIAEELKAQKHIEHCLIIAGVNSLKNNWKNEILTHSNENCIIIGQEEKNGKFKSLSIKERVDQLKNKIDEFFIIINIESLRDERVIDAIKNSPNKIDMIVFDEVHKAKSRQSIQGKNLIKLEAEYMIGATGTLIINNPLDCYLPLAWLGIERKNNVTNFKKVYCIFDKNIMGKINGFRNIELIKDVLNKYSLRRTKDLLDLPEKNIINKFVDLGDEHLKFYKDIKNQVSEEVDKIELNNNNLLALTTRLRQAVSCPTYLTTKNFENTKLSACADLVEEITSAGDKVVIFTNFKETIEQLKNEYLKDYKVLVATGETDEKVIEENIRNFQNDEEHQIFIGTIQKMGTGFTLTRASYMIFIDLPWTQALYEQACDRIHRIGSKNSVFIYNLIANNTIDRMMLNLIEQKKAISDYIVDDKFNYTMLKKFLKD